MSEKSENDDFEIEHDDEMIEVPIVPEPLSAISTAALDVTRGNWWVRVETPMYYLFEHKLFPHFTCTVTVVGRGSGKVISFDMRSFSGLDNEKLAGRQVLHAEEILRFIATFY